MNPFPTIGRIVHFSIPPDVAQMLNSAREKNPQGGTQVMIGEKIAMIITRVKSDTVVNGKMVLDGKGELWAQNVEFGVNPGQWSWPEVIRVYSADTPVQQIVGRNGT